MEERAFSDLKVKMKKSGVISKVLRKDYLQIPVLSKEFFFMILLFIVFIPSTFNKEINSVSLYLIIPFLFVYSLYKSLFLVTRFRSYRLFIFLCCWMLFSGIVAVDMDLF